MTVLSGDSRYGESSRGSTGPSLRCHTEKPSTTIARKRGRAASNRLTMRIGFDTPIDIELKRPVTQSQENLLHVLGEFPNRYMTANELCERLGVENLAMRIQVCRLRKCLTADWTIESRHGSHSYRLIDLRDK